MTLNDHRKFGLQISFLPIDGVPQVSSVAPDSQAQKSNIINPPDSVVHVPLSEQSGAVAQGDTASINIFWLFNIDTLNLIFFVYRLYVFFVYTIIVQ